MKLSKEHFKEAKEKERKKKTYLSLLFFSSFSTHYHKDSIQEKQNPNQSACYLYTFSTRVKLAIKKKKD